MGRGTHLVVMVAGDGDVATSTYAVDTECNHTLLKMRILAFLPISPCSST